MDILRGGIMQGGNYCVYQNNIYKYTADIEGDCYISTTDLLLVDHTFKGPSRRGVYKKKINKEDLDGIYRIEYYVIIDEKEFDVIRTENDKVLLGTNDFSIAESLCFERTDKYYYEKWIDINTVEIKERKIEIVN